MAQFVHQYVAELLKRQHSLAQSFPDIIATDPMYTSKQLYSLNLMNLILMGSIMKVVSTVAPAVTDAVWLAALDDATLASEGAPWPEWILRQDVNGMGA